MSATTTGSALALAFFIAVVATGGNGEELAQTLRGIGKRSADRPFFLRCRVADYDSWEGVPLECVLDDDDVDDDGDDDGDDDDGPVEKLRRWRRMAAPWRKMWTKRKPGTRFGRKRSSLNTRIGKRQQQPEEEETAFIFPIKKRPEPAMRSEYMWSYGPGGIGPMMDKRDDLSPFRLKKRDDLSPFRLR